MSDRFAETWWYEEWATDNDNREWVSSILSIGPEFLQAYRCRDGVTHANNQCVNVLWLNDISATFYPHKRSIVMSQGLSGCLLEINSFFAIRVLHYLKTFGVVQSNKDLRTEYQIKHISAELPKSQPWLSYFVNNLAISPIKLELGGIDDELKVRMIFLIKDKLRYFDFDSDGAYASVYGDCLLAENGDMLTQTNQLLTEYAAEP